MTNPTRIIRILPSTSLPCSIYNPSTGTTCGKPAEAAYAQPSPEQPPGQWLVQPVCRECAIAAKKTYEQ